MRHEAHSTHPTSNLNELFLSLPNLIQPPVLIIRRSGRPAVIAFSFLFSADPNSRDGTARGGLRCLRRRWFLFLSASRTISALRGQTHPGARHLLFSAKSKLGARDWQERKKRGTHAAIQFWHRIPPPTHTHTSPVLLLILLPLSPSSLVVDLWIMGTSLNYGRFPRLDHPIWKTRSA